MNRLIAFTKNGSHISFDKGSFDNWCIYLQRNNQPRYAPKDTEYFSALYKTGNTHGHARIYNDFVRIYSITNSHIQPNTLTLITAIAHTYGSDAEEIEMWLIIIYAGMVAEENKANAILGKRIKRLGIHQVLLENMPAEEAASFSKGKKWQELDALMKKKGF